MNSEMFNPNLFRLIGQPAGDHDARSPAPWPMASGLLAKEAQAVRKTQHPMSYWAQASRVLVAVPSSSAAALARVVSEVRPVIDMHLVPIETESFLEDPKSDSARGK